MEDSKGIGERGYKVTQLIPKIQAPGVQNSLI